jgi:hypothetical protein
LPRLVTVNRQALDEAVAAARQSAASADAAEHAGS